ncbi:MAG TPA: ATP-binding cassette domain-containing protein [Gaiellaceae bacterium]|nr:ATP-binding cassette domain-containing protein [Gaiellaceae bacterium]
MPDAIIATELRKSYPKDVVALDGLSLSVEAGTIFALLGPNGAGKSTTVKILTTLSRPDGGTASVAGNDVLAHPDRVRHAIGVVGQKAGATPEATARENLVMQGEIYGVTGTRLRQRIAELLAHFDLADAADRPTRTYSGGMLRRLDIAIGLVNRPQVLFLDEPTTGLDPEARTELWQEIERLAGDEEMTILLTTHYLDEADRLAARLAIVEHGRIVAEGTPDGLKSELRGDAIQIELAETGPDERIDVALRSVAGISDVRVDGRSVRARAEHGATAVPAVLNALESGGLNVGSVTMARPSLDDVYLRYAGRVYREGADEKEQAA